MTPHMVNQRCADFVATYGNSDRREESPNWFLSFEQCQECFVEEGERSQDI
jgi:hypothetical protein